jgi:hypothetical protein
MMGYGYGDGYGVGSGWIYLLEPAAAPRTGGELR